MEDGGGPEEEGGLKEGGGGSPEEGDGGGADVRCGSNLQECPDLEEVVLQGWSNVSPSFY
jgi:hypothetical protein